MHTITLELQEGILDKFKNFLSTLPNSSVKVIDDIDDNLLSQRKQEINQIIQKIDNNEEELLDFDASVDELINNKKS